MILLCGIPSESPLARVEAELVALRAPYVWFNQRRFAATGFAFAIDASGGVEGALTVDGETHALSRFTGVYQRLMDDQALPELSREPPGSPLRARCRALHEAVTQWLEVVDPAATRVVNRASAMASNFSKPYQAQVIARHGLLVPPTLITNDPELVHAFRARHRRVVYKSVSGVRSIVQTLEDADLSRLDAIRWCPTQFQAYIPGTNVRVHVVGGDLFATAVLTEATDYRYAEREASPEEVTLQPYLLPEETADACLRATAALGLGFAGVDLKITPEGRVYCFEINPSPAFSYYEEQTGQPIARAVARFLQGLG